MCSYENAVCTEFGSICEHVRGFTLICPCEHVLPTVCFNHHEPRKVWIGVDFVVVNIPNA